MENLDAYSGEMKALFGFIRYQRDKVGLAEFVEKNRELFHSISPETVQAIAVMGNAGEVERYVEKYSVTEENGEERVDMCKALEDMMADARQDGYDKGEQNGYLKGEHNGKLTEVVNSILDFLHDLGDVSEELKNRIRQETDLSTLRRWLKLSARAASMEEFTRGI